MIRLNINIKFIFLTGFFFLGCQKEKLIEINIIPLPQKVHLQSEVLQVDKGFKIETLKPELKPLIPVIQDEMYLLTGLDIKAIADKGAAPRLQLDLNTTLKEEEYRIEIKEDILIEGGSYAAVAMGTTSALQMLESDNTLHKGTIQDAPENTYRSLMIDCARGWHPIENLKQIITMARWYKIKYLHLHLTDDQLFTFQSLKYPELATADKSYTQEELSALSDYAFDRGVILVPEIDIPAHASQFINKMPETFGIADLDKNRYTMTMGREEVYDVLGNLFKELAEVFQHSPYIHIGGDEAHFDGMAEDPETIAYMAKKGIPSVEELFRHFIVRINAIVKATGKQTLVWAGFKREGTIEIPRDIIVISWEAQYYDPQLLLEDGYTVINASFKPLYIVNNRKWSTEYIYTLWNKGRWGHGTNFNPDFVGMEVDDTKGIIGATMCSWEQASLVEVRRARKRLAAFSENIWGTKQEDYTAFSDRLNIQDSKLERLFYPFEITETGKIFPEEKESNFYEHLRFDSTLVLEVKPRFEGLDLRYNLSANPVTDTSKIFRGALQFNENATVTIQAFEKDGTPVGHPFYSRYFYYPLRAVKKGLEVERLASSWERLRFNDELEVVLQSPRKDLKIEYKLRRNNKQDSTAIYTAPLLLTETTHLSAKLLDENENQIGSSLNESYYFLKEKNCLTTGKKVTASNERLRPRMAEIATNGRASLWEHWSDQTNGNNWILVDLEKMEMISSFQVHCFWDNYRYYQYTIESSLDGEDWKEVVDFSKNEVLSSFDGYTHEVEKHEARYLRLNVLFNSANPGLHITEFCAY